MFGFVKKSKIDKAFSLLNERMPITGKNAENIFNRSDLAVMLDISGDVETTVEMMLLAYQADTIQRFVELCPYQDVVQDLIDVAKNNGEDIAELVTREGDQQYLAAKGYCDDLADRLVKGKMLDNPMVQKFCAAKATLLLTSSARYRLRLQSAYAQFAPINKK